MGQIAGCDKPAMLINTGVAAISNVSAPKTTFKIANASTTCTYNFALNFHGQKYFKNNTLLKPATKVLCFFSCHSKSRSQFIAKRQRIVKSLTTISRSSPSIIMRVRLLQRVAVAPLTRPLISRLYKRRDG